MSDIMNKYMIVKDLGQKKVNERMFYRTLLARENSSGTDVVIKSYSFGKPVINPDEMSHHITDLVRINEKIMESSKASIAKIKEVRADDKNVHFVRDYVHGINLSEFAGQGKLPSYETANVLMKMHNVYLGARDMHFNIKSISPENIIMLKTKDKIMPEIVSTDLVSTNTALDICASMYSEEDLPDEGKDISVLDSAELAVVNNSIVKSFGSLAYFTITNEKPKTPLNQSTIKDKVGNSVLSDIVLGCLVDGSMKTLEDIREYLHNIKDRVMDDARANVARKYKKGTSGLWEPASQPHPPQNKEHSQDRFICPRCGEKVEVRDKTEKKLGLHRALFCPNHRKFVHRECARFGFVNFFCGDPECDAQLLE